MKQINLKTNEFNKRRKKDKGSSSLIWGVLFLALSAALYGVVYFYKLQTNNKISAVQSEITTKQSELNSEEFKKVYDFEKRLIELQSKMNTNIKQSKNLVEVAKKTFQETYFRNLDSSVEAGRSDFVVDINVPDFDFLARQITAFNSMENLDGEVHLEDSVVKETGVDAKIKFSFVSVQDVEETTPEAVTN
jgi:hypothetical protein